MILPILTIPHHLLKKVSNRVEEITPDIARLIDDLAETLYQHPGCVGIAAPQAGRNVRIAVVDASRSRTPALNHGFLALVNPMITASDGRVSGREGCLSVPDFTGNVTRAGKVAVRALDRAGREMHIETAGFEAVVFQHEIDHLDGLLFLDRVTSLKTDVFRRRNYLSK